MGHIDAMDPTMYNSLRLHRTATAESRSATIELRALEHLMALGVF